uniref:lamina-associated polypeptide 2, isoforms beta/delta/epsilon/gamma-like isoform X2 n=1 Tax=Pristiophorus japonicus TaxID=55135 RepID=UPI00398EE857
MPEYLEDPSVLTKERLKSELIAHSVSLPLGEHRKDVYVQLYRRHLTARNTRPAGRRADFSSDEEGAPGADPGKKSMRKTDKTSVEEKDFIDVTELTDEDLKEQLTKYGFSAGPIVATTRKVYEKKLGQLMDKSSATEENQPNGSTDSDQYSDTEEEIIIEKKELFSSKTKTPVITRQRKSEYNWKNGRVPISLAVAAVMNNSPVDRQLLNTALLEVVQKELVKDSLLEKVFPNEAPTPTGISATCRRPIRGAAGRPVEFTFKDALPRRPLPKIQPVMQVKPEKSKSRRSVPIWIQIVVLLIVAFFLFLVYQAMETNKGNPFPVIPEGSMTSKTSPATAVSVPIHTMGILLLGIRNPGYTDILGFLPSLRRRMGRTPGKSPLTVFVLSSVLWLSQLFGSAQCSSLFYILALTYL